MSQFERDINLAIQQSLEEEKKKQEDSNQVQTAQAHATPGNTTATPQGQKVSETSKIIIYYF